MWRTRASLAVAVVALLGCTRQPSAADPPAVQARGVDAGVVAPAGTAWDVTRWGMSRAEARAALEKRGLAVTAHEPMKSPDAWLNTSLGDFNHITVYFDERDRLNQVVLIAEKTTADVIARERSALDARFGASTQTRESFERRWDGPEKAWFKANQHEGTYLVEEIYQSHSTAPSVGMPIVSFGESLEQTRTRLKSAGYAIAPPPAVTNAPNADNLPNMPNGPPVRTETISFGNADVDGSASIEGGKLTGITLHQKRRLTRAEAEQLGAAMVLRMKSNGESETSTETTWSDATTGATLESRQKNGGGEYAAIVAYHQKVSAP